MSCIDAAIIKALVEHIGGNPDDVLSGNERTIFPNSSYTKSNNTTFKSSTSGAINPTITIEYNSSTPIKVGDVIEFTRSDDSIVHYLTVYAEPSLFRGVALETGEIDSFMDMGSSDAHKYTLYIDSDTEKVKAGNLYIKNTELSANESFVITLLEFMYQGINQINTRLSRLENPSA